jgi:hypothetical protein
MEAKAILSQGASNKPIQFAIAGLVVLTGGYFLLKKVGRDVVLTPEEKANKESKAVSKENPFSFAEFMSQPFPDGTPLIKVATAQANAKQIYNALSGYFFDDPDIIIGLFNSYKNKAQVSQMAQAFYNTYKRDLLTFLKNGNKKADWILANLTGGLSTEDYDRVITIVNKKSKF